jgi:putative ATP-binding cassette transporter
VAFENVTLATPDDGRLLIANLSVEVPRGKRLLIVGPDGSGRTVLMRATAGLWKTGQGRIARPPLERMMFLPQQPYLTLGSLRDQLLYNTLPGTLVSVDRLPSLLQDVQLGPMLERVGGLDAEQRDWTNILSLGEQQCLAFARLLLAVPEFAFLDEALSALPAGRVQDLYELLSRTTTTYLSIGSRQNLLAYHDQVLQLQGDGTWTVSENLQETDAEWDVVPSPILDSLQVG